MSEGDGLLQYPKHSNGGEGPSTIGPGKHVPNSQPASEKTASLRESKMALENARVADKLPKFKQDREGGDAASVKTPKPRERRVELITYKSVECGINVTDIDLVAESSVNIISTSRDRKQKEILFEVAGDSASGESLRLLSFCRIVKSFTIVSSEGPVMPDRSGRLFEQRAETNILHTESKLSSEEIGKIMDDWDILINCVSERIASCGSKILSSSNNSSLSPDLLRVLANVTDVADQLERDAIVLEQALKYIATEEWRTRATELKESIKSDLVTKVNSLFGRASNIMSIDEAYKAREQNASLKRLSWVTFIFLPLLFVASLYGMNVDILKDNPRWTTYFYIAVPTFVLVIFTVVLLKYLPLESMKATYQSIFNSTFKSIRIRTRVWDEEEWADASNIDCGFFNASVVGSTEVIKRLLCGKSKKIHTIFAASSGDYLRISAMNGHEAVVRLLLEKGADKDIANGYGRTPLILAAGKGHEAAVRHLLEKEADKDKADEDGCTALIMAARYGQEAVVQLLLEKGADKDKADSDGSTPLSWAARNGHEAIVRLLLENGADKDKADSDGKRPLDWAIESGKAAVAELLKTFDERE